MREKKSYLPSPAVLAYVLRNTTEPLASIWPARRSCRRRTLSEALYLQKYDDCTAIAVRIGELPFGICFFACSSRRMRVLERTNGKQTTQLKCAVHRSVVVVLICSKQRVSSRRLALYRRQALCFVPFGLSSVRRGSRDALSERQTRLQPADATKSVY